KAKNESRKHEKTKARNGELCQELTLFFFRDFVLSCFRDSICLLGYNRGHARGVRELREALMEPSDQDGVQPLNLDIVAWRRVRLGLTCMRRAQFSMVGAVPLTLLLGILAVILNQTGVLPGRLDYVVGLPMVLFFVGLIALFLCGLA